MDKRIETEMIALLPRLRRFAFAITGSWPDADDLVQATCTRAIERLEQWEAGSRLDSWMYRIAQNLHRNDLRKIKVRRSHLQEVGASDIDTVSPNTPMDRLVLGDLGAALKRLPADQRMALVLTAVEGRGYQEVADLLEMSPGTVASRVSRARAALVQMLEGEV